MTKYKLILPVKAIEQEFSKPLTFSLQHQDGTVLVNFTLGERLVWTRADGFEMAYNDPEIMLFVVDADKLNISSEVILKDFNSDAGLRLKLQEVDYGNPVDNNHIQRAEAIGRGICNAVLWRPHHGANPEKSTDAILMFVDDRESMLYNLKCKAAIYGYRNFLDRVYITLFTERFGIKLWDVPKALEPFLNTNNTDADGEYKTVTLNVGFSHIEDFQFDGEYLMFNCSLKGTKASLCIPLGVIVNVGDDRYTPELAIALPMLISEAVMEDIKKLNSGKVEKPKPKLSLVK